jgi:dethiobiotin synthetase
VKAKRTQEEQMSETAAPVGVGPRLAPIEPLRLARAKAAYTVRRVGLEPATVLLADPGGPPRAGDVVLARVSAVGQHRRIERADGRRAALFPGDEVIVAYGNRYAPDQYEAEVPGDLGPCALVAAGGVAARMVTRHSDVGAPTQLEPVGLLAHPSGARVNLADWALPPARRSDRRVPTIAVAGTAMNAGKTTTAAGVIRGLRSAGMRVGAAKVTGTGAGGDLWLFVDAGADPVLDFTAAGMASTYLAPLEAIEHALRLLHGHLAAAGVDAIVLEVADGLYQGETARLITGRVFRETVDGVLFAAGDALGGLAGVEWLRERGLPVVGVSGRVTASPLAAREASASANVPVLDLEALGAADIAALLATATVPRAA